MVRSRKLCCWTTKGKGMVKMIDGKILLTGVMAVSLILSGCGSEKVSNENTSAVAQQSSQQQEQPKKIEKTKQPEKEKTLQQKALEDSSASMGQKNALKKAISYAKNMHMSKLAVYEQLTSEYGEKFPEADAQWAVERLSDIDWKKNALEKAKSYQKGMSMSVDAIYDQLTSEYGERFTPEEAQYAVDNLPR